MRTLNLDYGNEDSEFNDEESAASKILSRIKSSVQMPLRMPYGKKMRAFEVYFSKFDEDTINRFISKLSSSVWVKNSRFSLEMIVRDDMVNTIFSGTADPTVCRYYSIETLTLKPLK
jgi:hypothetical protein|nr:MAG TPA: hypothetical protein [Bacteriophage sp.]